MPARRESSTKRIVRLVHWSAEEARPRVDKLRTAGYAAVHAPMDAAALRALRADPPAAFVIDLGRRPSQGRDVAIALRGAPTTRRVPIVFVDGEAGAIAKVRALLPDATYTTWSRIAAALRGALAHPPADPVVPGAMAGYAGTPLPRKLGVRPGALVALISAPPDFEKILGKLPAGARLARHARGKPDLVIWFTTSCADLEKRVRVLGALAGRSGLWIAWPKKSSKVRTDLTQGAVRKVGQAAGLVDYKVCAIDETWSGLRFTRRAGGKRNPA